MTEFLCVEIVFPFGLISVRTMSSFLGSPSYFQLDNVSLLGMENLIVPLFDVSYVAHVAGSPESVVQLDSCAIVNTCHCSPAS
ncbi:hypothetical protein PG2054B_0260 [Bifidobacterium pseudolongum subsp. pseudolongum]|uniref:Uncharacterized protein n=1 Tax=Bifidobacterium pseudolongum subsp. pseudolongum TaxID=31954 RepID=A0A4Q5AAB9_9BIFI|nr:hypothetical protein BPSP_1383 [Bifidobacterium pseudolongum subsp. pseudolongum]RYQ21778.1 hypothetical protein PG2054B_0260 [Bifidobacterium pseudolongum subsp. pseudolongum]